jgi:hypothetical protein
MSSERESAPRSSLCLRGPLRGLAETDLPRHEGDWLQRCGSADGSRKDKGMTDPKDMSDPQVRPPFWHHRYYYLALKIIVLLAAVLIALRIVGLW